MRLFKTRPTIKVRVPNEIRAGDELQVTVDLDCKRALDVESVTVRMTGKEYFSTGGDGAVVERRTLVSLGAQLSGERRLAAGTTELRVRIPLPPDVPPSYKAALASIQYELTVRVAIPWWPDRRESFEVFVAPPEVENPEETPQLYSSNPRGPVGNEAHVEVSLSSPFTRVGDVVSGAFALNNVAHNRYSEVKVGLRSQELLNRGPVLIQRRDGTHFQIRLSAEQVREGEMIPFRFRLPEQAIPGFDIRPRPPGVVGALAVTWVFELIVGIRWGSDLALRVPFLVLPSSMRAVDAQTGLAPPTVGSDRLRTIWEEVGSSVGLRYTSQALSSTIGETLLIIRRDHSGQAGIFLVAEIRFPELNLGIEVVPSSAVQKVIGGGARIGDAAWDRDYHVRARDEEQVAELLRALVPHMDGVMLKRFDDETLVVRIVDAGLVRRNMQRFCATALELAKQIEHHRRSLPPPNAMRDAVQDWEALAHQLGAKLETARMRVAGVVAGLATEVRLSFDKHGQPLATCLSVATVSPLNEGHTFRWTPSSPGDVLETRFQGEALELARIAVTDAASFTIERERMSLELPALLGVGDGLTAAHVERRADRLARLIGILRGQVGPYR